MAIKLKVKLIGVFRGLSGRDQLHIDFEKPVSIETMIKKIVELFSHSFKQTLIDPVSNDPRPNTIILVNGKEISVLNGIETEVNDGDEIVLIPVSHGG